MQLSAQLNQTVYRRAAQALAISVALLTAIGCVDNESASSSQQSATASLGVVTNATANFYAADGNTLLGSSNTGSTGTVTIQLGSYRGPVVVEIVGDNDAMYFDEQSGTLEPFTAGQRLRAIVPSAGGSVGVTTLTELAYQTAVNQQRFPLTANIARQINEQVGAALAPGLSSILSIPATFDAATTANSLSDDEAGRYALSLAALAGLGGTEASPALAVLQALVADIVDGVIDSQANGSPITTPYSDFIANLNAQLTAFANNFGDAALQQQVMNLSPTSTSVTDNGGNMTGGNEPNGETTPAVVNADLVGDYLLVYEQEVTGGPFSDDEMVMATVTAASELQIAGKTLSSPFFRVFGDANTAEIIWLDSADNIEYALTNNNSGTFREINVGNASAPQSTDGIPGFLGQLTEEQTNNGRTAPPQLVALAGDYSLQVVGKNGSFRSSYTINQPVNINISTAGVVTVDGQNTLNSTADDAFFSDESRSFIPRYELLADDSDGNRQNLRIYLDGSTPVAWQYQVALPGSNNSFIDLEARPLPTNLTATVDDLSGRSPITLTGIVDDSNHRSGYELCQQFTLTVADGATFSDSNTDFPFFYQLDDESDMRIEREFFDQQRGRYAEDNGVKTLSLTRNRIIVGANGRVDLESIDFMGTTKDQATNDPAAIAAAGCSTESTDPEEGNLGKSRVTDDGFTGDVNGTVYTYEGSVALLPNNSGDGVLRIEGSKPNDTTSKWRVFLPNATGTYDCDDSGEPTVLEHLNEGGLGVNSGAGSSDGSCRVKLVQAGPTYEGYFTGNFVQSPGEPMLTVTDGYFFLDTAAGGTDDNQLPAGDNVAVLTVDDVTGVQRTGSFNPPTVSAGDVFQLTMSPGLSDNSSSTHGTIWAEEDSGRGVFLQLVRVPKRVGSFNCGAGFAFPGMTFNTVYNNGVTGSSCTINVESITDDVHRGTFEAVLGHSQEANSFATISGSFRAQPTSN